MDSLFAIVRRVAALCAVAVLALAFSPRAFAGYADLGSAYSACQSSFQSQVNNAGYPAGQFTAICVYKGPGTFGWTGGGYETDYGGPRYSPQTWFFGTQNPAPPPTGNPCASLHLASVNVAFTQQAPPGNSGATWTTDPMSGLKVQCPFTITYSNYSALADSNGFFHAQATFTYTGNAGSASQTATAGSSVYNDASGNPLSPQPSPDPSPAPQLCGGTSCADPNTGNVCYTANGTQTCRQFPAWTPNMTGGCTAGGSGAICAGSPNAPTPQPGQGGVTDPSTQIVGSDHYTSKNMTTGQVSTVVVNTYSSVPGQTITNGATSGSQQAANSSGSQKPASSSSSGSNSGYGSGGDCNSPPVCSGDAVLCGIGRQEWYAMCTGKAGTDQLHKDVAGDGNGPPTFASDSTKYNQSNVWSQPDTSQDGTVGGQANKGVYDQSGFGFNTTCPLTDLNVPFFSGSFAIPLSEGCVIGPWLRAIIIGFALFSAAVITAGGRG